MDPRLFDIATLGLHLGLSAKLKIWQVPTCKMEPRSGYIFCKNTYMWLLASDMWLLASDMWLLASNMWLLASDMWLLASNMWLLQQPGKVPKQTHQTKTR